MNSKINKATADALPGELSEAIAAAEAVLKRHDVLATVLAETGRSIPQGLAAERDLSGKLGRAEITGTGVEALRAELATVQERRRGDARRRQSAIEGLLELATELVEARRQVSEAQGAFARTIVLDFQRRWAEACRVLAVLRGEAAELSSVLRVPVPTPAPYVACINLHGDPQLSPVTLAEPMEPATLPTTLVATSEVFNKLDAAAVLGSDLGHAVQLNAQHQALSRLRVGQPIEMGGVFVVVRAFRALGSDFESDMLLDRDVIPSGLLHRYLQGRNVQPVEGRRATAA